MKGTETFLGCFLDPNHEATLIQSQHLALLSGPTEKRQSVCLALSGRL